jgi:ubiquinone/menaquinone biosynthesis C-methylase UbiE
MMKRAEFDQLADEYESMHKASISASGEDPEFFAHYKIQDVATEAVQACINIQDILDFGSGIGNSLPHFAKFFPGAAFTCADVSARSIEICRERFSNIRAQYSEISGLRLAFADDSFDLAFSACTFHHIPQAEHSEWLIELKRVTRKNGMLVIFEHNPLNPLTRDAVRNCPFDENAVLIGARDFARRVKNVGWRDVNVVYRIFFPHALAFARPIERLLRKVPLGAQYFVTARNL